MQLFTSSTHQTEPTQADIELIVRELGGGHSAEEVCRMLCMQRGYEWLNAQNMVAQVSAQSRARIARRQAPFLLFLGLVTLIGGALLVAQTGSLALHYDQIHSLLTVRYVIVKFGLGVVMIVGSAVGMGKAIIDMWK
jgi:hypothetical protein